MVMTWGWLMGLFGESVNPTWSIPSGKHTNNYGKSPCSMGKSTISMVIFNSKLLNYQRVENIRNREKSLTDIENHQQSPSNYGIENAGKWWNMQISHVGFPQHVQLPPPWLFIRFFKGGSIEPNSTLPQVQVMLHHVTFFSLFHSSNVSYTNLTATNDALVDSGCPAALFFQRGFSLCNESFSTFQVSTFHGRMILSDILG